MRWWWRGHTNSILDDTPTGGHVHVHVQQITQANNLQENEQNSSIKLKAQQWQLTILIWIEFKFHNI